MTMIVLRVIRPCVNKIHEKASRLSSRLTVYETMAVANPKLLFLMILMHTHIAYTKRMLKFFKISGEDL